MMSALASRFRRCSLQPVSACDFWALSFFEQYLLYGDFGYFLWGALPLLSYYEEHGTEKCRIDLRRDDVDTGGSSEKTLPSGALRSTSAARRLS